MITTATTTTTGVHTIHRNPKMKRKRNSLNSSSIQTRSKTNFYLLPDECWEIIFKFIINDSDRYLESLSLVSKQFLSITNRLKFSLKINGNPSRFLLRQLFQRFTNLTSLDLTRFRGDLNALLKQISNFPIHNFNLKSLNLSNQSKIPSNGLRDLSKKIKTLTSLTCSKISSIRKNEELVLISDCFPFLEELDMRTSTYFGSFDVGVKAMSTLFPKLRKINLSGHYSINDSLLLHLFKNCEFLEEFIMLKIPSLTHDGIASALRERPTLKSLSVGWSSNDNISSQFVDSLVSLKGLTCLDLRDSRISDELLSSIAEEGLPLRRLVLRNCYNYNYAGISCLLSKCRCLQHLDLQKANFLNDQHVADLSSFLSDLVYINLSHCSMLTDSSFFALVKNCSSLSEIKMKYTDIGKMSVEDSNSAMNLVVNPQLKSLRLAYNSFLRNGSINMLSSICPNLEFLDLRYCSGISKCIDEVLRCCKIRHLNLACCSNLQLHRINFEVSTLEVLNLSQSAIDDRSLDAISKSCFGLMQLDLKYCYFVTKNGVKKVVKNCTKLREINLEHCREVDANVVDWMVSIRPSLRKITAPPSFQCSDKRRKVFLNHGCLVC